MLLEGYNLEECRFSTYKTPPNPSTLEGVQKTANPSTLNPPKMKIKIGTLNLCLGQKSKKELVKQTILNEEIDMLCMQETESNKSF